MVRLSDRQNYATNPFEIVGIVVKERLKAKTDADPDDRDYVAFRKGDGVEIKPKTEYEVVAGYRDELPYIKAFRGGILSKLKNMSQPAANMYLFIMEALGIGRTSIEITEKQFLLACGYKENSRSVYYAAVDELIERKVIARMADKRRTYWVNPNLLFNGDRRRLMPKLQ